MRPLLAALLWFLAPPAHAAEAEPAPLSEAERVFMPEFEFGVMAYSREGTSLGFIARTSLEYRASRLDGPFARLTYDTTTASYLQPAQAGLPRLRGPFSAHDVLLGGGYRAGSDTIQGVVGVQGGLHVDSLPMLVEDDELEITTAASVGAAVRASLGLELYVDTESAFTVEVLGQRMFGPIWEGANAWAGGALLGFTTSL